MKVLLIGMDGCHPDVFKRGWTPFASELLKSQKSMQIENDLLSRGWLEISLGEHAKQTKAMYDRPVANGTHEWKTEYSLPEAPGIGTEVKSLWQKLNENGVSVGVMNVPTTFPAPKVDGFFVSGGGGGAPVAEEATPSLCYPKDIVSILNEHNYIVDDRLYQLVVEKKLDSTAKILKRLAYKNERRTDAFLALNAKFDVDFGFIVYKTASVITETIFNTEKTRGRNSKNVPDTEAMNAVREYYEHFDALLQKLVENTPGAKVIFVSDHGTTPRTHSINPNIILQDNGLQVVETKRNLAKSVVSKVKETVPFWMKYYLKKTASKQVKSLGNINFENRKTKAFSITTGDWCHGIYINDSERFGGPVSPSEVDDLRRQIVKLINSNEQAAIHGISARESISAGYSDFFPDVEFVLPNGFLTTDRSPDFLAEFTPPESATCLASIMKGDILSMKSHHPIAVGDGVLFSQFPQNKLTGNLTIVHQRILDIFTIGE